MADGSSFSSLEGETVYYPYPRGTFDSLVKDVINLICCIMDYGVDNYDNSKHLSGKEVKRILSVTHNLFSTGVMPFDYNLIIDYECDLLLVSETDAQKRFEITLLKYMLKYCIRPLDIETLEQITMDFCTPALRDELNMSIRKYYNDKTVLKSEKKFDTIGFFIY